MTKANYPIITTCCTCGRERCMTFIVTVQGGTRTWSVAAKQNRAHYCLSCVSKRVSEMGRQEVLKTRRAAARAK